MNRPARKFIRNPRRGYCDKNSVGDDPEKTKEVKPKEGKFPTNRSCYFQPDRSDFGQIVHMRNEESVECMKEKEQWCEGGRRVSELQEVLHTMLCSREPTDGVDPKAPQPAAEARWEPLDRVDEVDRIAQVRGLKCDKYTMSEMERPRGSRRPPPRDVTISDTPRVKVIAEKFSRLKLADMEWRRAEGRLVCLEYDVTPVAAAGKDGRPQTLRAYFAVTPGRKSVTELTPTPDDATKHIDDRDFDLLNEKEIEIIDEELTENRPYLNDLRRILQRKQEYLEQHKPGTLNLKCLYDMARNSAEIPEVSFVASKELKDIKELLKSKSRTSFRGFTRRKVKQPLVSTPGVQANKLPRPSGISPSFFNELLQSGKA